MPDLEALRTFCVAAELGTLGRAATRLHVTQPAVSKRLHNLEALCGARLLDRTAHGVTLTPAGERLYAHARRILVELTALTETVEELRGDRAAITLAISPTAADLVLAPALVRAQADGQAPVEVVVANSRTVKRMVAARQVDVGVAACLPGEQPPGTEAVELFDDELVLGTPLRHPWARRRRVSVREFAATPIVRRDRGAQTWEVVESAMEAVGSHGAPAAVQAGTTAVAKAEAHARTLPAVLSVRVLAPEDNLEAVRVEGVAFRRRFCALRPPRVPGVPAPADRLLEALREIGATVPPVDA